MWHQKISILAFECKQQTDSSEIWQCYLGSWHDSSIWWEDLVIICCKTWNCVSSKPFSRLLPRGALTLHLLLPRGNSKWKLPLTFPIIDRQVLKHIQYKHLEILFSRTCSICTVKISFCTKCINLINSSVNKVCCVSTSSFAAVSCNSHSPSETKHQTVHIDLCRQWSIWIDTNWSCD